MTDPDKSALKAAAEAYSRLEELSRLHRELRYAESMSDTDWRYASIARMIRADISRKKAQ